MYLVISKGLGILMEMWSLKGMYLMITGIVEFLCFVIWIGVEAT